MQTKLTAQMSRVRAELADYGSNLSLVLVQLREFLHSFPEDWVEDRPKPERQTVSFVLWLYKKVQSHRQRLRSLQLWSNPADRSQSWKFCR